MKLLDDDATIEYSNLKSHIIFTIILTLIGFCFPLFILYKTPDEFGLLAIIGSIIFIIVIPLFFAFLMFRFGVYKAKIHISNVKFEVYIQDKLFLQD